MIDQANESLITLEEAANNFGGLAIPYETIRKYVYRGVKGVKLETVFVNRRYTSKEAVQRFINCRQGEDTIKEKPKVKRMTQERTYEILKQHGICK